MALDASAAEVDYEGSVTDVGDIRGSTMAEIKVMGSALTEANTGASAAVKTSTWGFSYSLHASGRNTTPECHH